MLPLYLGGLKNIISLGKKILLVVVVYFVVISLFTHFFNKNKLGLAYDSSKRDREQIYSFINDPVKNKTKEGKLTILFNRMMACGAIGEACTDKPSDGDINVKNSTIGFLTNLIVLPMGHPPASGIYWAKESLQKAGIIPKTYAATGIGFTAISPFSNIWSKFRDITYMIFVIVLIAIGFMIMFRMKLNPQTVISIENALPRIVIALLLVTFSFPLAGFLIDLMYLFIGFIISILSSTDIGFLKPTSQAALLNRYASGSFFEIFPMNFDLLVVGGAILDILPKDINGIIRSFFGAIGAVGFAKFGSFFWAKIVESIKNIGLATIQVGHLPELAIYAIEIIFFLIFYFFMGPFLIGILIFFTVIFLLFRIFFLLLTTYIQILLLIIFSPLILMLEAIPGRNIFSYWFKNLFVNLLVFPLVVAIILTGYLITQINASNASDAWAPPFLYGINASAFATLVGLGLILLIPDLIKTMKELLGVKGLPVNMGLGTFFGAATAVGGGAMGLIGTYGSLKLAFGNTLPDLQKLPGAIPGILRNLLGPKSTQQGADGGQ